MTSNSDPRSKSELFQQIASAFSNPDDLLVAIKAQKKKTQPVEGTTIGTVPQSSTERYLAAIWGDVLSLTDIRLEQDFFQLGGNSLQAIQVVSRIRDSLNVPLSLRTFFATPTLAALTEAVAAEQKLQSHSLIAPLKRRPDQSTYPLSFPQERLWFLTHLNDQPSLYNIPMTIRLEGKLDEDVLATAFNRVWQRHEALRARFKLIAGQVQQIISPYAPLKIEVVDLQLAQNQKVRVQHEITASVNHQFDLENDNLIRVVMLKLTPKTYILLLTMHHIIGDRWSLGVLATELTALYRAALTGQGGELPALPIQYADYAFWQRQQVEASCWQDNYAYWKNKLEREVPPLLLPTDKAGSRSQHFRGEHCKIILPQALTQALQQLSKVEGATLYMTLLAALKVLLFRYTAQEDLSVGTFNASRNQRELEPLIGYFVNTLVLRTDLSGQPTFRELLARVKETTVDAYAHQDFPFKLVIDAINSTRNLSRSPLFQVMFVLQNTPLPPVALPDLQVEYLPTHNQLSNFDLTLWAYEKPEGLHLTLEYNADLFAAETIDRMLAHYQVILEQLVRDIEQPIATLSILDAVEKQQILTDWANGSQLPLPDSRTISHLFEAQVAQTPHQVALIYDLAGVQQTITFAALNKRANQLAHYLQNQQIGPGQRVGLYLPRSIDLIMSIFAILKTGAAYVPLDTQLPAERLVFVIDHADLSLILSHTNLQTPLPSTGISVCYLDRVQSVLSEYPTENPTTQISADDPAYLIYTSGSTGQPKGVVGHHRGVINRLNWMWQTYPFEPDELCCHKTAVSFVDAIWEIFGPLLQGVSLLIISETQLHDFSRFLDVLARYRVSRIVLVPALLHGLLDSHPNLQSILPKLKYWTSSGEALSLALLERFRVKLPEARLLNLYGSSEVMADVTCYDTTSGTALTQVPIGKPIANTQVYILDQQLEPVPVGIVGELYVGGAGVAQGYFNAPVLTKQRFIAHSFNGGADFRLYKTGDLARYRVDGEIEFLGRADRQVQIRGYRVELTEIEAILNQHPKVEYSAVQYTETETQTRLLGYVVIRKGVNWYEDELHQFLSQKLPITMIPARIYQVDTLPFTTSGKVDRQLLAALPIESAPRLSVLPRTETERILGRIWQEILTLESIDIYQNFFALGGHSLSAMRLMAQIQTKFNQTLPLASLFEASTVAEMAVLIDAESQAQVLGKLGHKQHPLVAIQPNGTKPPLILVHGGGGQILFYQKLTQYLGNDQPVYSLQQLDRGRLHQAPITELAADYLAELQATVPASSYQLGGYCLGGLIAFEMAQQLVSNGKQVDLLALISPGFPPGISRPLTYYPARFTDYIKQQLPLELLLTASGRRVYRQTTYLKKQLQTFYASIATNSLVKSPSQFSRIPLKERYELYPYPGRISLFETNIRTQQHWAKYALGQVDYYHLPTSHQYIFREPHIQTLAAKLKQVLY